MIIGLEEDYYCAHTPIAVRVTGVTSDTVELQIGVLGDDKLTNLPRLVKGVDGEFKINLSPWVRLFTPSFRDNATYTPTLTLGTNEQLIEMTILFIHDTTEVVTKTFVNCSLDDGVLVDRTFADLKVWQCYPFSFPSILGNDVMRGVITSKPAITGSVVEYVSDCCNGVYVKWLNRFGGYSYWLFPPVHSTEVTGEEYFRIPENIFNVPRDTAKTAGFIREEILTVRDIVPKKYWEMMSDLITSPEVQMLRRDYVLGDTVVPTDWARLIQDSPTFETSNNLNTAEVEIDFILPHRNVQTRL